MTEMYCEALAAAIEMEKRGRELYIEALKKVRDPFAKKALEFLIAEEDKHIDKILRFNDYLLGRGNFDLESECEPLIDSRIEDFVSKTVEKGLKDLSSARTDIEIYEAAMNFEKEGYDAYTKMAAEEGDSRLKRFFDFLKEEEIRHFALLQNTLRYLQDPSYYFEDLGGWIFG
jgi:rubrerythrin